MVFVSKRETQHGRQNWLRQTKAEATSKLLEATVHWSRTCVQLLSNIGAKIGLGRRNKNSILGTRLNGCCVRPPLVLRSAAVPCRSQRELRAA